MSVLFNAVVCTNDRTFGNGTGFVKYRKINNKARFVEFVKRKYPRWTFINWYNKKDNTRTTEKNMSFKKPFR